MSTGEILVCESLWKFHRERRAKKAIACSLFTVYTLTLKELLWTLKILTSLYMMHVIPNKIKHQEFIIINYFVQRIFALAARP